MKIYPLKLTHDGKYENDEFQPVGDIFLHGKLETYNGYDLCGIKNYPKEDGIYDCEVMMDDGVRKAKLFYWHGKWRHNRGLVVQIGDDVYMQDAQVKFDYREEFL